MKSDAQLKSDVMAELKWEPAVTSRDINVSASDGVVTLSGTIPHYAEKGAAERAAQRVAGVLALVEQLEVHLTGDFNRQDAEIAESVVDALRWHVWAPATIHATVENGWVTLSGKATWSYERTSAENTVSFLAGVKGVINNIVLVPAAQPGQIQAVIEQALQRDALLDAAKIQVRADGGHVTLSGSIRSWHERDQACSAAWGAPGVTDVRNNLAIAP